MEINNSPSVSLIPVILGEKNSSQVREVEKVSEKNLAQSSQQVTRVVSESEKQAARQQLESENSGQNSSGLSRDESSLRQTRAINAYLDTEQEVQKKYLSDVIGIDVYT
jgi:Ni,Fe-hydrogenase III component G